MTKLLPGPKSLSHFGTLFVPYAIAAMAWAPPSLKTSAMPQSCAAQRIHGLTLPSRPGGVQSTRTGLPAICDGTPSMRAVENSGALPPGT